MAGHLLSDVLAHLRRSAWIAEGRLRRRGPARAKFAELVIEFDCRTTPRWNERRRCADMILHMGRALMPWFDRRPLRHIRIVCRPEDGWRPSVQVDGHPITLQEERN